MQVGLSLQLEIAPVSAARIVRGDVVWIRQRRWVVERATGGPAVVRLDVVPIDRRPASGAFGGRGATFFVPFDRPATSAGAPRSRRVRPQQALARLAGLIARAPDLRLPLAAMDAHAAILPHQLEPALASLAGRARLLIADDVGLGKTVQAGLILAELLRREPHTRALVLMPASLRDQWAEELRGRFAIDSLAADRAGLDALTRAGAFGDNPWRRSGVWLVSPDFLKQRHVLGSMPPDPWDLLIIDEAHAVCGDSARYAACQIVAERSRRVILLTATPHSGDETRFSRLIALGGLGEAGALTVFRRTRQDLGWPHARAVRWLHVELSPDERATLDALGAFERAVTGAASTEAAGDHARLLLSVFRKRALSTFGALARSLTRRLAWLDASDTGAAQEWRQFELKGICNDDNDDNDGNDGNWITLSSGLTAARERAWLRRVRQLADRAAAHEGKVSRVAALIRRAAEPVVVFTEFRDSLAILERHLGTSCPVSILHGGQGDDLRRQQLRRFLDGSVSVLLATDVASQGLNLQARARWVISLELPWNPGRLEQRIGRVDRISQARPTHFTLTVARHPAEQGLLQHLARRVLAAQRSFSADALDNVMPAESDVRAALLPGPPAHAAPGSPPAPPPRPARTPAPATAPGTASAPAIAMPARPSRRWTRAAGVIARALIRRRALAVHWRGFDTSPRASIWARTHRASAPLCGPGRSLLVFSIPLLDGNDELVERLLVPVAARIVCADLERAGSIADTAITDAVRRAVQRRLVKAMRATSHRAAAMSRREELLQEAIRSSQATELQPGLFSQSEQRAFDDHIDLSMHLLARAGERTARLTLGSALRGGEPTLEVALLDEP